MKWISSLGVELRRNEKLLGDYKLDYLVNEISSTIKPVMQNAIQKTLEDNSILKNSDEIKQVTSWIKEATGNDNINASNTILSLVKGTASSILLSQNGGDDTISHTATYSSPSIQNLNNVSTDASIDIDSIYSKIANIIAERLSDELAIPYAQVTIENVKIQTQNKEKQATFDVSFVMDSIKPYISYVKKINRIPALQLKTTFQIDSDITLSNVGLTTKTDPNQNITKIIGLNTMNVHGVISLLKISNNMPIGRIQVNLEDEPKTLKEFEFEIDLSKISIEL